MASSITDRFVQSPASLRGRSRTPAAVCAVVMAMMLFAPSAPAAATEHAAAEQLSPTDQQVRDALENTARCLHAAYAREDIAGIMRLHHPDVVKVVSYNKALVGHEAVEKDTARSLQEYRTEFVEHKVENVLVLKGAAVQQTLFGVKRIPKGGGEPYLFRARSMVTYVPYDKSPTGWVIMRAIVQPATQ